MVRKLVIMTVSLNGMTLPSWASHLLHRLAPPPLLLVQAFVNTLDLDLHTDVLAHAEESRAWLAEAGLRDPGQPDLPADLELARAVRESLRALIARNTGGPPLGEAELRPLRQVTGEATLRLEVTEGGQVRLETGDDGRDALVGHISIGNEQKHTLADGASVLAIFPGPHAYISPRWYTEMNVPTWNYLAVHVYGTVQLMEGKALREALSRLIDTYEQHLPHPVHLE